MVLRTVDEALTPLFAPRAIGLIGASSASPNKLGLHDGVLLEKFAGPVLLVNGRGDVPGTYRSVAEGVDATGTEIDLAILCVPSAADDRCARDAAKGGARAALLCSGGFAEIGPAGRELQDEVAIVARELDILILGPNTSDSSFPQPNPCQLRTRGGGAPARTGCGGRGRGVDHALAFAFARAGVGMQLAVGLGNSFDATAADVLDYLVVDDRTRRSRAAS